MSCFCYACQSEALSVKEDPEPTTSEQSWLDKALAARKEEALRANDANIRIANQARRVTRNRRVQTRNLPADERR